MKISGFVSGHGFSRAENTPKINAGFTDCRKTLNRISFVTGHDFSRAVNATK
jgi:hypothetical protein